MSDAFSPPADALTVETRIDISAPPERVWSILTDFGRYGEWNSYISHISGSAAAGTQIHIRAMEGPAGAAVDKKIRIEAVSPYAMHWVGGADDPNQFRGDHFFEVEAGEGNSSVFLNREYFTGTLANMVLARFRAAIVPNFEKFNACLKRAAETPRKP